jgi:hypothetical protein
LRAAVNGLATVLAVASATTYAVSTAAQHRVTEAAPAAQGDGVLRLLAHLIGRPAWLAAQSVAVTGFVLHALALSHGPISLVQPLVISGIVLVVPLRAALGRRLPSLVEVRAVAVTAVGLALFLVATSPSAGSHAELDVRPAAFAITGAGLAIGFGVLARFSQTATRRAFMFGVASGMLFALVAGLLKLALQELGDGGVVRLLTSWPAWAVLVAGITGVVANQVAYRAAHLSASMPVLNIVDGMGALVAGYIIFREVPRHSAGWLVVEVAALIAVVLGLRLVAALDEASVTTTDREPTPEDAASASTT